MKTVIVLETPADVLEAAKTLKLQPYESLNIPYHSMDSVSFYLKAVGVDRPLYEVRGVTTRDLLTYLAQQAGIKLSFQNASDTD